jgi:HPt (histidine-containing phosphotransfer) domain-containing protein
VSVEKHVDLDKVLGWLEGDRRMLERIRVLFLKNIPDQLQRLGESLERGDSGSAEREAHTIRGSSAMMGAVAMACQAGKIEQSVIERDLPKAQLQFSAILLESEQVIAVLRALGESA